MIKGNLFIANTIGELILQICDDREIKQAFDLDPCTLTELDDWIDKTYPDPDIALYRAVKMLENSNPGTKYIYDPHDSTGPYYTLMVAPPRKCHVNIVFGEQASCHVETEDYDAIQAVGGHVNQYEFNSIEEKDAFMLALNEMDGWFDWVQVDDETYEKIERVSQ